MKKKEAITQNPVFWIAASIGAAYLALTALYQLVPLSGQIAMYVFTAGIYLTLPFGLSILITFALLFSWKSYKHFYLPFLLSVLTYTLLHIAWFSPGPTGISKMNDNRNMFYYHTKVELPQKISEVREYDSGPSFNGDGDSELSFRMDATDMRKWMDKSGFEWKRGPYREAGRKLNQFDEGGALVFKDSADVQYVHVNRNPEDPEGHYSSNYTNIFVNEPKGWILVIDYDS